MQAFFISLNVFDSWRLRVNAAFTRRCFSSSLFMARFCVVWLTYGSYVSFHLLCCRYSAAVTPCYTEEVTVSLRRPASWPLSGCIYSTLCLCAPSHLMPVCRLYTRLPLTVQRTNSWLCTVDQLVSLPERVISMALALFTTRARTRRVQET